jgi:uncharacterized glyoxalase superfamily protein PhnB
MTIHEGFPYLRVRSGEDAIRFYTAVFEAKERFRLVNRNDGRIGHAELELAPKPTAQR